VTDIYKEFGVDFLRTRYAGPTAAEMKMAQEITRLRARIENLEREMRFIGRLDYPPTRLSAKDRARAALKEAKP